MQPNLFHFATSELSQDAFLCWFLSWASDHNKDANAHLNDIAKSFMALIYSRAELDVPAVFSTVEVKKQVNGIDILCIVNNDMAILIEDKVGTKQHSQQLQRYKKYLLEDLGFTSEKVIPLYIQTRDQSDYLEVEEHGFHVIRRCDLLAIFEGEKGIIACEKNDILHDFSDYLRELENDIQSYATLPISEWTWNSWIGFYSEIQKHLQCGHWGYVPNPAGGFLGYWWHSIEAEGCSVYAQLEMEKFCFKICVYDHEQRAELRHLWHGKIKVASLKHGLRSMRPKRFGSGDYMTVAILEQEYRVTNSDSRINLVETLKVLKTAQLVIDECLS
ncbi:PD-(D/E)XK nuclease family protein [Rheinheimera sp. 1928-s]|uniref:PD-(D/E)XK nuclease family protein n=1 Tax=Rheinheimera sp. 1928-s TaxID=3033803 RepID=UPI00262409D4|nr:PD-(D/E)XK nuclease family protein [Rheinheimera sp. 1928-s]MDF3124372.1 PD-(D/E)XK nuclease family protein [Rheinheimera sp. 1928-s]